jgi:DMSO/TMAO reductase YedYZ molybdopterin-dependent catalytic subunit
MDATSSTPPESAPAWFGPILGVLAAAAGLAAAELVAGLSRELRGPVVSIGDRVIDKVPPAIKDLAIRWFGTSDKVALVIGILVVLAIIAALVGRATVRGSLRTGMVGAGVLGLVGVLASATGRNTSATGALPAMVAALVAAGVLYLGYRVSRPRALPPDGSGAVRMGVDRRQLLLTGAGVAVAAGAVGSFGRVLQRRFSNEAARAAVALPDVADPLAAPPADPAASLDGLSELFTPNSSFYRIDTALILPSVDLSSWRLKVTGMVERELELSYDELLGMDMVEADVTICCVSNEVGGDLVGNARWLGTRLDAVLERAGISPDADQVVGRSVDGFTAGFPVRALDGRDALIVVGMNGEALPTRHGFPARLVVPGLYGYVSATKWLSEIELTRFDRVQGYWVPRGWAVEAPIKTQSRIDRPTGRMAPGTTAIAGVAWAPTRAIERVEVRIDDGEWREVTLGPDVGDDSWRQWWVDWVAEPGEHTITCRATDGTGATQVEERTPVDPDGATGWHTVRVLVEG